MVCFEEEENIIIDSITGGPRSLDIVSIVGMGGLGKTTLAKKLYKSVKSHFVKCAFAYISQIFDKRKLFIDILKDIGVVFDNTSSMSEDDLADTLKKCLRKQEYFIVMDDIWNTNPWEEVKSTFPDDQNGSRVMFTTRSLEVAQKCQIKCSPHCLRLPTEDESWQLLQKKVFGNNMQSQNLYDVAKLVAKKCHCLPLSIAVMASLLATTETSLWIDISKKVSSYLFDEGCMNILELSYNYLPEYLKPCLLYLGAFPEDSSYKVKQVTLLWIAEGFIKESNTKSLNDVAKEYIYKLVKRNLIIVDKMTIDEIHTFRVHDLIYKYCRKKCQDENFCPQGDGNEASSLSEVSIYHQYRASVQELRKNPDDARISIANTRSLVHVQHIPFWAGYSVIRHPLWKLKFAQVLHLDHLDLNESDIEHLFSMVNLRHIEAYVFGSESITPSISNLWNIRSLILRGEKIYPLKVYLPESLWRMKSLRHVQVDGCSLDFPDGYELPQLDKVVSFSKPILSCGKDVERLLQRLPAVRELKCVFHFDSDEEKIETFVFHRELESLKLSIDWIYCPFFLINFPSTLIKLTLERFQLSSTVIAAIVELKCLKILKLRRVDFPEPTWEMEGVTFPNLKYFELSGLDLEQWNPEIYSFPCLEELLVFKTKLEKLSSCFTEMSTLKKITLESCSSQLESSALEIQEDLTDLGKNLELLILKS